MPDKMNNSGKLGLLEGTLYDVLDDSYVAPDATVAAVGFNITCQYLPLPNSTWDANTILLSPRLGKIAAGTIDFAFTDNDTDWNSVTVFTTGLRIFDSNLMSPEPLILDPPMTFPSFGQPVTEVQFFRCSQTPVNQQATVNTQTGQASVLDPNIFKQDTSRTWSPYKGTVSTSSDAAAGTVLQMWATWLAAGYTVNFGLSANASDTLNLRFAAMFLIDYLNLWPGVGQQRPSNLSLSTLEDALACLNAYVFWSIGHATPGFHVSSPDGKIISSAPFTSPVTLLEGNATVYQCLRSSTTSSKLLYFCRDQGGSQSSLSRSGFLHAIWLFRSHPDLEGVLPNVEDPTESNLRTAGMVPVKLIDPSHIEKHRVY
ncbi:hypothetical protein K438DRAFT_1784289 [Mycena galopus ATCC 62051]|nr:hypothetical protein K438DRAFT_1784289 [Mycena galopus ATCC 62051]